MLSWGGGGVVAYKMRQNQAFLIWYKNEKYEKVQYNLS